MIKMHEFSCLDVFDYQGAFSLIIHVVIYELCLLHVFSANLLNPRIHKPYHQTPKPWRTIDELSLDDRKLKYLARW